MTSGYVNEGVLHLLLRALMPENAFALLLMECTGMRITDCLSLTRSQMVEAKPLKTGKHLGLTYTEQKTGKERTVTIPAELWKTLLDRPRKSDWLFPGRNPEKHRTRQAVFKDLQRACKLFRIDGRRINAHISPHSARKLYAVRLYHELCENGLADALDVVRMDLNHKDRAITLLYAMADELTNRKGQIIELTN